MKPFVERTPEQLQACHTLRDRIAAGCAEAEFEAMRCPVCNAELILNVHRDHSTFSIRCTRNSFDMFFHGTSNQKPDWWPKHMRGGWF